MLRLLTHSLTIAELSNSVSQSNPKIIPEPGEKNREFEIILENTGTWKEDGASSELVWIRRATIRAAASHKNCINFGINILVVSNNKVD